MFGNRSKAAPIDSLIGAGTTIEGDLHFKGGMRVDGIVKGTILSEGQSGSTLIVSESGRVEGEIRAPRVVINGEIIGPVYATESAELMPKARVSGDLHYRKIEIHMGAQLTGKLIHDEPTEAGNIVDLKSHQLAT
jgi:cytoskeletal protein CcmA (bactofilin family)